MLRSLPWCLTLALICAVAPASRAQGPAVFLNEIHYDNAGTDAGEFIEIAGPAGTDLAGYSLVLYNGAGGVVYGTTTLSGTIPDQQGGFGTLAVAYAANGLQNGSPDGVALVAPGNVVLQFLSYEGAFTAAGGPANGMLAVDIGVSEAGGDAPGSSLQLQGTGTTSGAFTWSGPAPASQGAINAGQSFGGALSLTITDASLDEGDSGMATASFTVSLSGTAGPGGVSLRLDTADESATAGSDYVALSGVIVTIPEGAANYTFDVLVHGDLDPEPDETFVVEVSSATGASIADGTGRGTIRDDDETAPPAAAVVINEVDSDTPGTDIAEFIELYDGGAGNTPLDGLVLVLYNGSDDRSYAAFDLDGLRTNAAGYAVLGNAGVAVADRPFGNGLLQNGADAVAVYAGNATDFPNGTAVQTSLLVDAVVYDTSDADDTGLLGLLNAGQPQVDENGATEGAVHSIQRCPNGGGGARNTQAFVTAVPTPGAANGCPVIEPGVPRSIADIQGTGDTSPYVGTKVVTSGVVTGRKINGFFLQSLIEDQNADTSEAVFVFTGSTPQVGDGGALRLVRPGDVIEVTGRVVEFRRTNDARPHTFTELSSPLTLTLIGTGQALPPPLDAASLVAVDAASRVDQLERYESMLIAAGDLHVVSPTNGFGEFYAVVNGTPRPFREPGITRGHPRPAGAPGSVPEFDGNFERLMIETDEQLSDLGVRRSSLQVSTGTRVTGVFGPLDYAFDEYRISVDASAVLTTSGGVQAAVPVPAAAANEFTIASANFLNFINPAPDRMAKASMFVQHVLRTPAILGAIEVGSVADLQQVADAVNAAAGTSYQPLLLDALETSASEQNIGYLVDRNRVEITAGPTQLFKGNTFEFEGQTDILHDRPPLILHARVRRADTTQTLAVTVMLLHLKSLIEVDSETPNGGQTQGARNREKRRLAAEDIAHAIADRADQNLVVLGDFNAFEFNDGYVDVEGTLRGAPAPADEVVAASADVWDYELTNLLELVAPEERYSYTFGGNAQVLDHVLVSESLRPRVSGFAYARNNVDFANALSSDPSRPERFSDHDAPVAYFRFTPMANLAVAVSASAGAQTGSSLTYTVTLTQSGPDEATSVRWSAVGDERLGPAVVSAPEGWTCGGGSHGDVSCGTDAMLAGATATFTVSVAVQCAVADGTVLSQSVAATSATPDEDVSDNASAYVATAINPAPTIQGVLTPIVVSPVPGAAAPGAVVNDQLFGMPSVSDNCPGATLVRSGTPLANLFPVGVSLVTFTAVDSGGAQASTIASVHVLNAAESLAAIHDALQALAASGPPPVTTALSPVLEDVQRAQAALASAPARPVMAAAAVASAVRELEEVQRRRLVTPAVTERLLVQLTGVNWLLAKQAAVAAPAVTVGDRLAAAERYLPAAVAYAAVVGVSAVR